MHDRHVQRRKLGRAVFGERRIGDGGIGVIRANGVGDAPDRGIEGGAMRIEAAVPKLMVALARSSDRAERRAWLLEDLAGERA